MTDLIYMDCPGSGCPGNLATSSHAQCQFCNERLPLLDGRIPQHLTTDDLAMGASPST